MKATAVERPAPARDLENKKGSITIGRADAVSLVVVMKVHGSIPAVMALLILCIAAIPVAAVAAPDLVVQTFDPPSGVVEHTFTILNAVRNAGTTGSGSGFTVGFVLSSDTTFNLDDTLIGTREVRAALAAGFTSLAVATNVTIPDSVPDGTYYLGMFVDTANTVAESNEAEQLPI